MSHGTRPCKLQTAHLAEGRSCDLSMSLPLIELCRQDISPEKPEHFVNLDRLRESLTRAEDRLSSETVSEFVQLEFDQSERV